MKRIRLNRNNQESSIDFIECYIRTIYSSNDIHSLIVEGSHGWGKSYSVNQVLKNLGYNYVHLGCYCTNLALYNLLFHNSSSVIVIDDCGSIFNNKDNMNLLLAATNGDRCKRLLRWKTSSKKAVATEFEFHGKFIFVYNQFARCSVGQAIQQNSYY